MGKKYFLILLFDVVLPIAGILLIGRVLAQRFDYPIFHFLDTIRAFGLGFWFAESEVRVRLLNASRYIFAFFPAVAWVAWIRINLEQDRETGDIRLDRPIFRFCSGLARRIRSSVRSPEDFPLASAMPAVPASAALPKALPSAAPLRGPVEPVLRVEPVRHAAPAPRVEPTFRAEPVVRPEPSLRVEPVAHPEPVRRVEPSANPPDDVMPPAPAPGVRRTFAPGPAYPRRVR